MARIKYSALVENIRGSIGGTTFQRNRYGYSVKSKQNTVKPWTIPQQRQKQIMTTVAQQWRTLTDGQRADWNTWAEANPRPSRLNPDAYLSGYNLFLLYHRYRQIGFATWLNSPSLVLRDMGPVDYNVYHTGATLEVELNPTAPTGAWYVLIFLTNVVPFGREFVNVTPRYMTTVAWSTGALINVTAVYQSIFGTLPPVGQYIGIKLVFFCDTTAQVTVTPTTQVIISP